MSRRGKSRDVVGRDQELAQLDALLSSLIETREGRVVLISGEAGIGKSRLVEALLERADQRNFRTSTAQCVQFGETMRPAAPVLELMDDLTASVGPDSSNEAPGVLDPGVAELTSLTLRASDEAQALETRRLFELVESTLVKAASVRPQVVVFEDLHWADRTTRDLLGYLSGSTPEYPILLAGTYRSDDLHRRHPLLPAIAELQRSARPERLDLKPLDLESCRLFLDGLGELQLDVTAVEDLHRRSGGNAFFLEELAASDPADRLSMSLRDVVLGRAHVLDENALVLARILSQAGPSLRHEVLANVASLDDASVNSALRQLLDTNFLVRDGLAYGFRHELTREVFVDELLPGERSAINTRLAEALLELAPDRVGEIAHHWYEAGNDSAALLASAEAGVAASEVGASSEALTHLERALELWDRVPKESRPTGRGKPELLLDAAQAASFLQNHRRAAQLAVLACGEATKSDRIKRARTFGRAAELMWLAGHPGFEAIVDEALELIEDAPAGREIALVLASAARIDSVTGRVDRGVRNGNRGLEIARAMDDTGTEINLRNSLLLCRFQLDDSTAAAEWPQLIALAIAAGERGEVVRGYNNFVLMLASLGKFEEALATAYEALRFCEDYGYRSATGATIAETASYCLALLGRWAELDELTATALHYQPLRLELAVPSGLLAMAKVAVKRGDFDAARPVLEHDIEVALRGDHGCSYAAWVLTSQYELATLAEEPPPASDAVQNVLESATPQEAIWMLELVAAAIRREADCATAARYRQEEEALASARAAADEWLSNIDSLRKELKDNDRGAAYAAQCQAEWERAYAKDRSATWAVVAGHWEALNQPWDASYSNWRAAEALLTTEPRAVDARARAKDLLSCAYRAVLELDASPIIGELEDLAKRSRIELENPDDAAQPASGVLEDLPFELTNRELEVLRLVAKGYSNGRIGEELFISTKTASVHVSNILRKLGAANRIEAAAIALQSDGLLEDA